MFAGVKRDLPEDLTILKKSKSDILRLVSPIVFNYNHIRTYQLILPSCRYDRRCSTNIPLLFLKYKLVETRSLSNAINICLRKTSYRDGQTVTVSDILNDASLEKMIAHDDAFKFLKTIRSSPAFWQQKQKELMCMIRQLGCPTFFLTLSAAETKWPELLRILKKILDGDELSTDTVLDLQWNERAQLIRRDPVTCARYFDHRSKELFKVLRSEVSPLGKLTDFYMRIENAPKYGVSPLNEVIEFIDRIIQCKLLLQTVCYLVMKLTYNVINIHIHVIRENHSDVVDLVFLILQWLELTF